MRDNKFRKYHAKWESNPDENIDLEMYNCQEVKPQRQEPDSLELYYREQRKERVQEDEEESHDGKDENENTDIVSEEEAPQTIPSGPKHQTPTIKHPKIVPIEN